MKKIDTLKMKVLKKLDEMIKYSEKKWNIEFGKIDVNYSLNSTKTLGNAKTIQNGDSFSSVIKLNEAILLEFSETYIEDVFVHEVCHVITRYLYPSRINNGKRVMPHGREFKDVCGWFGNDGRATTNLFSKSKTLVKKRRKTQRFFYDCGCMTHKISTTKHNKIQRGSNYICTVCDNRLVFTNESALNAA